MRITISGRGKAERVQRLTKKDGGDELKDVFFYSFKDMRMKQDHQDYPLWVCPNRRIYLESYSPVAQQAKDFLIAIANPVTRPRHIHEYKITSYSLYAASSLGLRFEDILSGLNRLSKNELHDSLINFIHDKTEKAGKVRIVLRRNSYFVESPNKKMLEELLKIEGVADARKPGETEFLVHSDDQRKVAIQGTKDGGMGQMEAMGLKGDMKEDVEENEGDNKPKLDRRVYSFEIMQGKVEQVKEAAKDRDFPTLEEYDYQNDKTTPNLNMNLRAFAQIRPYQERCLAKMFGFGRARSGIIVLPCGAGKTLVGITAAQTIGKSTLVVATTDVAVNQWKKQFEHWTTINDNGEKRVIMFSREHKRAWDTSKAVIVIASYHMLGHGGQREKEAEKIMQLIRKHEWGLIILDEVHVAAAKTFRRCVSETYSRCKLGLTATLVREDKMVDDLHYLVGPKLYEANWLDLQDQGYIACVQCIEVKCRMDPLFYKEYLMQKSMRRRQLLYEMNPSKFNVCEYLIRYHEARGDKILVFSDNRFTLETYARTLLNKFFIHGDTSHTERLVTLDRFQRDDKLNTLFISKIGDNSIDLPDVNVIIQISSHFAARRQEAQRLGRILRPKPVSSSRFNAFFYTLVSSDTTEVKYATKRQRFLVDQGYAYRIVRDEDLIGTDPKKHGLQLSTPAKKASILAKIRAADEMVALEEEEEVGLDRTKQTRRRCRRGGGKRWGSFGRNVRRRAGNASDMSGGSGMAYRPNNAPRFFRDHIMRNARN